jgi:hypothetical protein
MAFRLDSFDDFQNILSTSMESTSHCPDLNGSLSRRSERGGYAVYIFICTWWRLSEKEDNDERMK